MKSHGCWLAVLTVCLWLVPVVLSAMAAAVPAFTCTPTAQPKSTDLPKWRQELVKPPVYSPVSTKCGVDRYAITVGTFKQVLHPALSDKPTQVYGYDGSYPGFTFEAKVERPVKVTWMNELPDEHILPTEPLLGAATPPESAMVTHLHGGHTPAISDGNPKAWVTRGHNITDLYPNEQLAATLWYHDHALSRTRANVMAGLAGFYLLRDEDEAELHLPTGDFEIPIAIQDRVIQDDGQLFYPCIWQPEFFGDTAVVNGRVWPFRNVEARAYRFRLLNGCNSRFLHLSIPNGPKIWQIGTDGGFLHEPVGLDSLLLGPGERADIIVDFHGFEGKNLTIMNDAPAPFPTGNPANPALPEILQFRVASCGGSKHPFKIPCLLKKAERAPEDPDDLDFPYHIAKVRDLTLVEIMAADQDNRVIPTLNGMRFEDPSTENPLVNTVELWRLINLTPDTHPIHLHEPEFRLQQRQKFDVDLYRFNNTLLYIGDPIPPPANENGWKDVIQANPGEVTTILVPFLDFVGQYVWHCHILEHEDNDMMRPLVVRPRHHQHKHCGCEHHYQSS